MSSVAVVGTGLVGRGWAIVFSRAGHDVRLYDISEHELTQAMVWIRQSLDDLVDHELLTVADADRTLDRITPHADLEQALRGAHHVQESITENLAPKQALFQQIERLTPPDCVLASSTSALLPSDIAQALTSPERFIVCHPVNPPHLVPLVEVVPSSVTDEAVISRTMDVMRDVGQHPILIKREIAGFVLNRLQVALVNEAISLVRKGIASVEDVDAAVREGLGYRWSFMGPMETIDLNAPDGIADYLQRFTNMYALAGDMTCESPFSPEFLLELDSQRRRVLSKEDMEARRRWRDRKLMEHAKLQT